MAAAGTKRRITPARAKALALTHPVFETVEGRVDHIAGLMAELVWIDETSKELQTALSQAWGLDVATVRRYSAEASRKLHDQARDDAGRYGTLALRTLAEIAQKAKNSRIPGDKNAAVNAADKLLKYAGLAEPEAAPPPPSTLIQVGQIVTGPVLTGLLPAPSSNGHSNGTNGHVEAPDAVPGEGRNGSVV